MGNNDSRSSRSVKFTCSARSVHLQLDNVEQVTRQELLDFAYVFDERCKPCFVGMAASPESRGRDAWKKLSRDICQRLSLYLDFDICGKPEEQLRNCICHHYSDPDECFHDYKHVYEVMKADHETSRAAKRRLPWQGKQPEYGALNGPGFLYVLHARQGTVSVPVTKSTGEWNWNTLTILKGSAHCLKNGFGII